MQSISKFHGFLEQPNGGNARGSGLKTAQRIFRRHPSNGDHRNRYRTANGRQAIDSLRGPVIGFGGRVENRAKVNIVRAGSRGAERGSQRMAGNSDKKIRFFAARGKEFISQPASGRNWNSVFAEVDAPG